MVRAKRLEESRSVLDSAEEGLQTAGGGRWEPLLRIVQGDLARALSDVSTAVRCYEAAIGVARYQQALTFELVARSRLVELPGNAETAIAAVEALRSTYEKFTEGWHFPPLRAAKALIEAASH